MSFKVEISPQVPDGIHMHVTFDKVFDTPDELREFLRLNKGILE